jgi:hypothetical protein
MVREEDQTEGRRVDDVPGQYLCDRGQPGRTEHCDNGTTEAGWQ